MGEVIKCADSLEHAELKASGSQFWRAPSTAPSNAGMRVRSMSPPQTIRRVFCREHERQRPKPKPSPKRAVGYLKGCC